MRLLTVAAALALAVAPVAAIAQDTPAAAASPATAVGVTVAETVEWLKSVGAEVGEPTQGSGRTYLNVNDGRLNWTLWFYTCPSTLCDDVQFGAIFTGGQVDQEKINTWNRDNRFLKAFYIPAAGDTPARSVVQYDVLLTGSGVAQLVDPTSTWADMVGKFADAMGFTAPAPAAPAAAQ